MRKKGYLCSIFRCKEKKVRAARGTTIDVFIYFNKQNERNYKEGFVA